ncbi:MAG: hypothetical protein AAF317_18220 [Pseudomonadota bacterium]
MRTLRRLGDGSKAVSSRHLEPEVTCDAYLTGADRSAERIGI